MSVACAAPQQQQQQKAPGRNVPIISSMQQTKADGTFSFGFESADGTKVQSSGAQKQIGPKPEQQGSVQRGSYTFTTPEGQTFTVNWIADENGFQPSGEHIAPPPPQISQ